MDNFDLRNIHELNIRSIFILTTLNEEYRSKLNMDLSGNRFFLRDTKKFSNSSVEVRVLCQGV